MRISMHLPESLVDSLVDSIWELEPVMYMSAFLRNSVDTALSHSGMFWIPSRNRYEPFGSPTAPVT